MFLKEIPSLFMLILFIGNSNSYLNNCNILYIFLVFYTENMLNRITSILKYLVNIFYLLHT